MNKPQSKNEATTLIRDIIRRIDPENSVAAEHVLGHLDVAELLESLLDTSSRGMPGSITTESYVHANGFYRISLPAVSSSPVRLRLHTWPSDKDAPNQQDLPDAHSHKWPFVSRILAGGLMQDILKVELGRGEFNHFRHVDHGNSYGLTREGPATLEVADVLVVEGEITYQMNNPETVHRVFSQQGQYTVTLVAELAPTRDFTDVYTRAGRRQDGKYRPQRLGNAELESEFKRIKAAIRGGRNG